MIKICWHRPCNSSAQPTTNKGATMKKLFIKSLLGAAFLSSTFASEGVNSYLGKGLLDYDYVAGLKDRCVQLQQSQVFTDDARSTIYHLELINSKKELYDKISMSSSASGSYGVFSAGAKASFVKERKWEAYSNYILVKAVRFTKKQSFANDQILLSDSAKNVMLSSRTTFADSCGTSFVNNVYLGGEIYGVIEIKANSYSEKQNIRSSLNASGSFAGVSASGSGSYQRKIEELSSRYHLKVDFQHIGGQKIEVPNTVHGLLDLSNKIEEISDAHPVSIAVETRSYATLSNNPIGTDNYETQVRQELLTRVEKKLNQARTLYGQIVYILENENEFKRFSQSELIVKRNYLDDKILDLSITLAKGHNFSLDLDISKIELNLDFSLPEKKRRYARKELNVKCEVKASPICGVETFQVKESPACHPIGVNTGSGPVCGEQYQVMESRFCAPKRYNRGKSHAACGNGEMKSCYHGKQTRPGGPRKHGKHSSCGYYPAECEHSDFGVAENFACENENHPMIGYKTCAHINFGYKYDACEHISHGPKTYKSCDVAKIGGEETFCPKF